MSDERLTRWRCEVRRVIPGAEDDLIEEVAQHAADRWACVAGSAGHDRRRNVTPAPCARSPIGASVPVHGACRRGWRPARLWAGWAHDVRYAARTLRLHPMFSGGVTSADGHRGRGVRRGVRDHLRRPLACRCRTRRPTGSLCCGRSGNGEQGQVSYRTSTDVAGASVFDARRSNGRRARQPANRRVNRARQHDRYGARRATRCWARVRFLGGCWSPATSGKPTRARSATGCGAGPLGSDPGDYRTVAVDQRPDLHRRWCAADRSSISSFQSHRC